MFSYDKDGLLNIFTDYKQIKANTNKMLYHVSCMDKYTCFIADAAVINFHRNQYQRDLAR